MTKPRSVAATANDNSIPGSRIEDGTITQDKFDGSVSLPPGPDSVTNAAVSPTAAIESSKLSTVQLPNQFSPVTRSVQSKLNDFVSVLDYGAVGNGTDDDTQAINNAIAAAVSTGRRSVYFPNTGSFYQITSSIVLPEGVALIGDGNRSSFQAGIEGQPPKIRKAASMDGPAIIMSGKRSRISGLGIYSENGAGGNGIDVRANYVTIERVAVNGHAGNGIKIGGVTSTYYNCNGFNLSEITCSFNEGHGVIVDDEYTYPSGGGPDANAGLIHLTDCRSNGGDGLRLGFCFFNVVTAHQADGNGGYGLHLTANSTKNLIVGGDQDEGNTLGEVYNAGLNNTLLGTTASGYTDSRRGTNALVTGASILNKLSVNTSLGVETKAVPGLVDLLTLTNESNPAVGRGVSIKFNTNTGTSQSKPGGAINVTNANSNGTSDQMVFSVNDSGSLIDSLVLTSTGDGRPAFDNSYSWGTSSFKWTEVWATNGTIQTSDISLKDKIKDSSLGLSFINSLRPVSYEWKKNDGRTHWGLIAQEVKSAAESADVDFGGWVGGEVQSLRYDQFIAPLIKAVQELSSEVKDLKQKLS